MNTRRTLKLLSFGFLMSGLWHQAFAQGSAITYQGRLIGIGGPANGSYDVTFQAFDAPTGGTSQGGPLTNSAVSVTGGLFTTTLDFGASPFNTGAPRWLEIQVRTNGAGAFSTLTPRQALTATPFAILAGNISGVISGSSLSGNYPGAVSFGNPSDQFIGAFAGSGSGLTNVDATTLGGVAYSNFWRIGGNAGVSANRYIGTLDYQPLELRVNNLRSIGIIPQTNGWPNVVIGASSSYILGDDSGASIGGGVLNGIGNTCGGSTIGGGRNNLHQFNAAASVIGGGQWNLLGDGSVRSIIGGGYSNVIAGFTSPNAAAVARDITDGTSNTLLLGETVGGATIGGGYANTIGTDCTGAVIGGGQFNKVREASSRTFLGGGYGNVISGNCTGGIIIGGLTNFLGDGSVRGFIGGGRLNSIADGTDNTITAGEQNVMQSGVIACAIGGGSLNQIGLAVHNGVVGGGWRNVLGNNADYACLAGGAEDLIDTGAIYAVVGGGRWNTNRGPYAIIPGGLQNYASGAYSFASGRRARAIHDGAFVWADSLDADFTSANPNEFCVRADGSVRFVTAGAGMTLDGQPVLAGNNGAALTNLNASSLSTGTVADARLSINVALRNAPNIFTATQAITGSLGIGTTNPIAPLHVNTPVGVTSSLLLTSGGSWPLSLNQTPGSVMIISNGGAGRVFLPASGNVGLGNSEPLHKLHVGLYGTVSTIDTGPVKTVVENTNENGRATLLAVAGPGATPNTTNRVELAMEADESQRIGLLGTISTHPLHVRVDNTTRLFIQTNGNVGLNTTTPVANLHVNGSALLQGGFTPTAATGSNMLNLAVGLNANGFDNGISFFETAGGAAMSIGYDGTIAGTDNNALRIYNSTGSNIFTFEHGGFLGLGVVNPANAIQHLSGALLTTAGVWQNASDVNRKTDFRAVNPQSVLAKVVALPVRSWRYTNELETVRHLGPTAQDFKTAFALGTDDKSIGTVDEEGVALAAIQGLNQKLETELQRRDAENAELRKKAAEVDDLKERLAALEQLLRRQPAGQ